MIWIVALLAAVFLTGTITLILMAVILLLFLQEVPVAADETGPRAESRSGGAD